MKALRWFSLLLNLLVAVVVHAHGTAHPARYGGQVVQAGDYLLEWVAKDNSLYVSDHDGKELATEGASGKIIAVSGAGKTTITLNPAGGNRLSLSEPLPAGAEVKAVISITLPGRPAIQARLESGR